MNSNKTKYFTYEHLFLLIVYSFVFIFCILNNPIYSHDTYSYLKAMPYRQLGYVIFLKSVGFIFNSYFEIAVIFIHTVFTLFSVHYFYKKTTSLFTLHSIYKLVLLALLLFPFFPPLSIANNITSEGLGYGFYLLFIAIGFNILFNKKEHFKYFILIYLGLVFVRSSLFSRR